MVATGQYTRLQQFWRSIASDNILRIKPQFAAVRDKNSGIATRLSQSIGLLGGLRTDLRGVLQSEPVIAWIKGNIDPNRPVLTPFIWTATNLTEQRTEYFYRAPSEITETRKAALLTLFRATIGPSAVFKEVSDEDLHLALFASAAIPVAFDPVELRGTDGKMHQYIDGGIASNTPIGVARTAARNVQVVLLDPPYESETYGNAVEIAYGVYGTMQRRLLENDIRAAFLQSIGERQIAHIARATAGSTLSSSDVAALESFVKDSGDTHISYIRPREVLPLSVGSFHDGAHIAEAMELGANAARGGFTPYTIADFFAAGA